jgi:hypothetical protein
MIENESEKNLFSTELSLERVRRFLNYNPLTGAFIWKEAIGPKIKPNTIAGSYCETTGYYKIGIDGHVVYTHKLIWFYVYGVWSIVDHINGIKIDNRLCNLRAATKQQNCMNQGVRITNLLGVKGVQKRGNKFRAYITYNYRTMHIGTYTTIEEAINARREAEIEYFGEFANTGKAEAR